MRIIFALLCLVVTQCLAADPSKEFVRVSPRDVRYFELSDGSPYIPIGLNMIAPPGNNPATMERWFEQLSKNHGNFVRIWLSNPFFDIEHERSGEYDKEKAKRIDWLFALAKKHNVRLKLCIEHFRHLGDGSQTWAAKPIHLKANGGPAESIADFFDGQASREQFKKKLKWYAERYGDDPSVFAWELWNEVNAVRGGDYMAWTAVMLPELHRLFPKNMAVQSLGSYDNPRVRDLYRRHSLLAGNDIAQVHRYLDLGARIDACKGPVDELAADAVRDIRSFEPKRPVLLAESGAVEPSHTGPFKLYAADKDGIILHDVLFAAFFSGAAGPGHIWHWDVYVDRNNLWHHFGRFAAVVEGIDPPAEKFEPTMIPHERLRIYALRGQRTTLIWCRDSQNNWMTELRDGRMPQIIGNAAVELPRDLKISENSSVRIYDPWVDRWTRSRMEGTKIPLPPFSRSVVVRIETRQQ